MFHPERLEVKYKGNPKILVIPDQHFPFVHKKRLAEVIKFAKAEKPDFIVNVGDAYDMYSFSRFAKSLDFTTPRDEMRQAQTMIEKMWSDLKAASPKARRFQVLGNHEERVIKNIMSKAPEYQSLLEAPIKNLTEFQDVYNMKSSKSELVINGVVFIHGWGTRPGSHMRYFEANVVHGHTHKGSIVYMRHKDKNIFELDCGYIADDSQMPLQYGETKTTTWNPGFGYIDKYGPRFISL